MGFFTALGIITIFYYIIYLTILCLVDCDVGLAIAEKFGKKLGEILLLFYPFIRENK